jgi:large subunit ribosomal protein L9
MNVILLEKVGRLGNLGDLVNVKPGYFRNYLYPKKIAAPATKENVAKFEEQRADLERHAAEILQKAQARADALRELTVTLAGRASEDGRLFGSFGTYSIAEAITKAGIEAHKSEIRLPDGLLRQVGEYEIILQLHPDVQVPLKVVVVAEV